MELTKYAQAIKNQLEIDLAKSGHSLLELEDALQNINTGEGVLKTALFGEKILEKGMEKGFGALASVPEFAVKSTLTGGALGGLAFDEMDKSVDSLNKSLEREREKINLVKRITNNLKREHGFI